MKRLIAIAALVLIGTGFLVLSGALGGDFVTWSSRAYTYITPGGVLGSGSLHDTSDYFTFPEDVKNVTFWVICDSGAANADDDTVGYKLYGITPAGAYICLYNITDSTAYADNAVESTGCRITIHDTFWHYHTVQYDSAAACPTKIGINGMGWIEQFKYFAIVVHATDTTDLGTSIRYTFTRYSTSGFTPY